MSILKSGVVDGMAYTLYSDGSIEAELPSGTIRFESIAALGQVELRPYRLNPGARWTLDVFPRGTSLR